MMTVGTPISASGAETYFKADFIKQETLLKTSADKNSEADENTPIEGIADAEEVLTIVNNSKIEESDGKNSTAFEDENSIPEFEPTGKSGSAESPAESSTPENADAPVSAVKDSSIESPITENPIVENTNTNTENSITDDSRVENSTVQQLSSDKNGIDFTQTRTRWVGKLSEELGLKGEVSEKEFAALSRGIHPQTGEQFIRHVKPRTVTDERGKTRQTKSHRAGLDQTLNAPKSVSLVVPYDDRIITAHWRAAIKAVETIEEFTTAKMGNVRPPERTGKAAYAAFLHFEARPDFKTNFAAPDLHTHFFEFNFARTADGRHRALETREVYRCQKLATAVYRSELLREMTCIGYEMRIDEKTGAPEIASISRAYIEASSPRQTEIKRTAEELGIKSTKIVASNYRRGKNFDPIEMRRRWDAMDMEFGSQAAKAAEQARHRTEIIRAEKQTLSPQQQIPDASNTAERTDTKAAAAVDFAIAQAKEQKDIEVSKRKWITRQSFLTEALNYSSAEITIDQVKAEFTKREKNGELREFELDRRKTKNKSEQENPILPVNRKDFARQEKSATEVLSNTKLPSPVMPPEKIETNHREISEIKLEIIQDSKESFEKIYDKTGILQSRTRTSGSRSGENDITADHTISAEPNNRTFHGGSSGSGDNSSKSNIISSTTSDAAISSNAFVGSSTGAGKSESKLTDYRAEHHRENGDSANGTQTGTEQNSVFGRRERELPDRSGSTRSGMPDERRIIGEGVEKSENGGESDKSPFKPTEPAATRENAVQEEPDFQPQTSAVEAASRLESGASVAKTEITGAKFASLRNYRTDDQAACSRQEITGNDREDFSTVDCDGEENTRIDTESERGVDRREKRDEESETNHRKTELGSAASRTANKLGGAEIEGTDERTGSLSSQVKESQVTDGKGFESEGFARSRISNGTRRAAGNRTSTSTESIGENEGTDRVVSATDSGSEGIGGFKRAESREKSQLDGSNIEVGNRAADFGNDGSGMLLFDKRGFKRELSGGEKNDGKLNHSVDSGTKEQNGNRGPFHQHGNDVAANISGSGETLQSTAGGAGENCSDSTDTKRRTAEKTAQIINFKRFSGGLDPQIVAEWTAIIEKSDAADFLNEVIKPKSRKEEQQLFGHLDAQAALIANQFKLPPPAPEAKPNVLKLALALTKIEAANYVQASGNPLSDKVFEVLVKENMSRAAVPPQPEQSELLQETFGNKVIESTVKPSSALEAETLNALLDSVRYGFDASAVIRAQRDVNTNEAAAQAVATLVQIAYGGQTNAFTGNFKNDLAEQIYYAPVLAIDIYQDCKQFDWRQTIETFAPTVNNLAEQYKIEIKPPDTDLERNKLLADFVARQLVEAYESQNSSMEKYVQNQLTANLLRAGNLEVTQPQKNTIVALTGQNLEPPKFSNALEASAYNTTKYDDEKKATQAINLADQIREAAKLKAEREATMEIVKLQVLTMR